MSHGRPNTRREQSSNAYVWESSQNKIILRYFRTLDINACPESKAIIKSYTHDSTLVPATMTENGWGYQLVLSTKIGKLEGQFWLRLTSGKWYTLENNVPPPTIQKRWGDSLYQCYITRRQRRSSTEPVLRSAMTNHSKLILTNDLYPIKLVRREEGA